MNVYKQFAENLKQVFEKNALPLCELDALAGDGDHGLTISHGFERAAQKVALLSDTAMPAEIFKEIGYAMLGSMGGASGPIFSIFFIQSAIVLKDRPALTGDLLREIVDATIAAIYDIAGARKGDKTMVDALYGVQEALTQTSCLQLSDCLSLASQGAQKGANATMDMVAKKGRAKFLGERSRGFMDAGSKSVSLIFEIMLHTFAEEKE